MQPRLVLRTVNKTGARNSGTASQRSHANEGTATVFNQETAIPGGVVRLYRRDSVIKPPTAGNLSDL